MDYSSKIRLEVLGLSSHTRSDAFSLVLAEADGSRRLSIVIGLPEAQSIAVRLENIVTPRPLTHDLFLSFAEAFDVIVDEIVLYDLRDNIFYSKIICRQNGQTAEIDARTSDAVAIALRFNCPIYTYEYVMNLVAISRETQTVVHRPKPFSIQDLPVEKLTEMMEEAVRVEDYERASYLRDIINSKK
ncbi:MAG: bifunctional nuclease family protein [Bacteroidales bacterium]|nr:bifunctional nuclease family protein [Bacteroidales bacterium]